MNKKDDQIHIEDTPARRGLVRRYLTGQTSLVGSVRSMFGTMRMGADVIAGSAEAITSGVAASVKEFRVESFDEALTRLSIRPETLPQIHNQILVQLYGALLVGAVAAVAVPMQVLVFSGGILVPLVCAAIAAGSGAMVVQSSVQALQIRKRRLGLLAVWVRAPNEWLPSPLRHTVQISPGDARLDLRFRRRFAALSRSYLKLGAVFSGAAAVAFTLTPSGEIPGAALLAGLVAGLALGRGIALSCKVMESRESREIDLIQWMVRPGLWWPKC